MLRREANRNSNNPQQYSGRGSGMRQQMNRTDDEQGGNRFNVNSVRQLQSNDKRNQGPLVNISIIIILIYLIFLFLVIKFGSTRCMV